MPKLDAGRRRALKPAGRSLSGLETMVSPDHHRALNLLANSSRGCLDSLLLGHGFSPDVIAELIDTGHATALPEQTAEVKVTRLRITEAGRAALER